MIHTMLVIIPDPDPVALPAPPWLLWTLLLLTFLLHVLAMNLALGGSILGGVTEMVARRGDRAHHRALVGWLSRAMPVAIAFTITLGVAPLLFLQVLYGRLFFTSSVLMAWPWLLIVPLLILGYYGLYLRAMKGESLGATGPVVGWISTLIFVAIGFLFTNNMTLMLRPAAFKEMYLADDRGLHLNLGDPTLIPRYLHFLVGAIAVAGLAVVIVGLVRRWRDPDFGTWSIRYGSLWFSIATGVNMVFGVWWLIALPRETMLRFMGGDTAATVIFGAGLVLALAVLMIMLLASQSSRPERLAKAGIHTLALVLVAMVLLRDQIRRAALDAAGFEPVSWVAPQWGALALFLVLLVAGIITVAWMIRIYRDSESEA
jgi:hypothetical protein